LEDGPIAADDKPDRVDRAAERRAGNPKASVPGAAHQDLQNVSPNFWAFLCALCAFALKNRLFAILIFSPNPAQKRRASRLPYRHLDWAAP
jgi:hypothetical protein